ncbi:MAG: BamA/TamA family outer membrane protein [Vicinamibacterales bacterium]
MASLSASIAITSLTLALASPVVAQETRAEEIARLQAEKAQQLAPNLPSGTEKSLTWLEGHFTDPNTAYLTFGGLYPSGGFAPGIAVRHAVGHARFNAGVAYSLRNYKLAHLSLGFPDLAGDRLEIDTHARWTDATQVPYYGVGNDSSKDGRVSYGLRALEAGGSAAFRPVNWFRVGGGIAMKKLEDRAGVGSRPSIEQHPGLAAPGLFTEARYRQATAFAAIDRRESPGYSRRGGLYSLALHDFSDRDHPLSFRRVDAEVQHLLPLLNEHWVLAFRGLVQTTDVDDDDVVPYYLLPSLGGARLHRGYADFRFQDRHMLLVSGEYRWMPSRVLDMALFVDAGKVTHDRRDLDFNGLKTAYGIGLRIHGPTFTPLRVDVARGKEGIRVHATGGIAF